MMGIMVGLIDYIIALAISISSYILIFKKVLHLCCLYGKYESTNMILKKYGSNQVNLNKTDFKGRTCMDLAWTWLINTYVSDSRSMCI